MSSPSCGVCTGTRSGSRSRSLCSAWVGTLNGERAKCVVKRKCCGWRDSQTDQWDQVSWLRCCWDGQRYVSRWVMWRVAKLGMDHTKLADSLELWTRERRSGFDAVARRHWEGRDDNLCLCVTVFKVAPKHNAILFWFLLMLHYKSMHKQNFDVSMSLHAKLINICICF